MASDDVMILRPDLNLADVTRVQDFAVHFVDVVLEMRPGGGGKQAVLTGKFSDFLMNGLHMMLQCCW